MVSLGFIQMRQFPFAFFLTLLTVACAGGPPIDTNAEIVPGYTADMTMTVGDHTSSARIMSKGEKFRMELQRGRKSSVMIVRYDLDKLWVLIPSAARYTEFPLDSLGMQFPHFFMPGLKIEKEKAGHDRIGSIAATKYRARVRMCGRTYEGFLWEAKVLPGYPLQWEDEKRRTVVRWRKGRITALSDTLFAIPDGFTELPSSMRKVDGRENRCRKQGLRNQGP
ncbi:MAG TPA: hypothetical protein DCO77_07495 [Nitrospiraceae bacterium]|nr:hypothetical protein [Nitrospiraceae bacterium]